MSSLIVRHNRTRKTLLTNSAATTIKVTTSRFGDAVNVAGYTQCILQCSTFINSTASPGVYLQGTVDGTIWYDLATLDSDVTTTANMQRVTVTTLTQEVRVKIQPATTSSPIKIKVWGEFLAA